MRPVSLFECDRLLKKFGRDPIRRTAIVKYLCKHHKRHNFSANVIDGLERMLKTAGGGRPASTVHVRGGDAAAAPDLYGDAEPTDADLCRVVREKTRNGVVVRPGDAELKIAAAMKGIDPMYSKIMANEAECKRTAAVRSEKLSDVLAKIGGQNFAADENTKMAEKVADALERF